MELEIIKDDIILPTKKEVLKLHLYAKLQQNAIKATDTEVDVLMELYDFGGYDETNEKEFFDLCVSKNFRRSADSVRNVISKFVTNGVILKIKKRKREINPQYLPKITSSFVGLSYKVVNAAS